MTVISKQLFYEKLGPEVKCSDIVHPFSNKCLDANIKLLLSFIPGIFYFYIPIYLIKFLYTYKNTSKEHLKKLGKAYLRSVLYGISLAGVTTANICVFCNLVGRLNYYTMIFWPSFFGGISLQLENQEDGYINTIIFATMFVETFLHKLNFSNIIPLTKWKETMIFMSTSSLLMHLLANGSKGQIPRNIWFYQPQFTSTLKNRKCNHDSENRDCGCIKYILGGFLKYFGFGLALNSIKNLIKLKLINLSNIRFGLLIGGYVGIFRLVSCLLFKFNKGPNTYHSLIAGLLAGSVYAIKPTKSFLAIAITTIIQILSRKFTKKLNDKQSRVLQQLVFMFCMGVIVHNRVMSPLTTPRYVIGMVKSGSNGYIDHLYEALLNNYLLDVK